MPSFAAPSTSLLPPYQHCYISTGRQSSHNSVPGTAGIHLRFATLPTERGPDAPSISSAIGCCASSSLLTLHKHAKKTPIVRNYPVKRVTTSSIAQNLLSMSAHSIGSRSATFTRRTAQLHFQQPYGAAWQATPTHSGNQNMAPPVEQTCLEWITPVAN